MISTAYAATLPTMVQRLVDRFKPDRIVLFGSHARGTADRHSDVDLLVVLPMRGSRRAKRIAMRLALHDLGVPTDIIVMTPQEVERQRHVVGTLARSALREGKVLYARS